MCAINDPLDQTHSPASCDHYSHLIIVLLCEILKSEDRRTYKRTDVRKTCVKIAITTGRDQLSLELTSVIGSRPIDWKNSSAFSNIVFAVHPFLTIASVTSMSGLSGYGRRIPTKLFQLCAHILPKRCAGIGPCGSMVPSPYLNSNV